MAERRMFTKKITESDAFLNMPASTQALYFHLSMNADDDGFINNPRSIQRSVGASDDDMKLLLAKKFIIVFETGVIVIKHWKMHNYIQADRYKPTTYIEEKSCLVLNEKKAYSLNLENKALENNVSEVDTECIQNVSIGKDRLGKDRLNNNMSNKELDELRLRFEQLAKNYRSVHDNPNGKSKARDKYIKWCTTGCKVDGKNVKFTPEQIENAFGHYVQEHINKEERGEWIEPYKNINTIMNNIMDWMEE